MSLNTPAPQGLYPQPFDMGAALVAATPTLTRYARSLTRDSVKADDLVQDTILCALSARHLFEAGTNFMGWTATIMRNHHRSVCRKNSRLVDGDEEFWSAIQKMPALTTHTSYEEAIDLKKALAAMPGHKPRYVFDVLEEQRQEDVALRDDIAVGTVKSRRNRIRIRLIQTLGPAYAMEPPAVRHARSLRLKARQTTTLKNLRNLKDLPMEPLNLNSPVRHIAPESYLTEKISEEEAQARQQLAGAANANREVFNKIVIVLLNQQDISIAALGRKMEKAGALRAPGITNLINNRSHWDELRIAVLLDTVRKTAMQLCAAMRHHIGDHIFANLPPAKPCRKNLHGDIPRGQKDPQLQPSGKPATGALAEVKTADTVLTAAQQQPAAQLIACSSLSEATTSELMGTLIPRLLSERLSALSEAERLSRLCEIANILNRPAA